MIPKKFQPKPQDRKTIHHRKCVSNGGTDRIRNLSLVKSKQHEAYHLLFANGTPHDVAQILNDIWIDPDYELIVKKRKK